MLICVPSRGRARRVPVQKYLTGLKWVLFVPQEELAAYRKAGYDAYDIRPEPVAFNHLGEKMGWLLHQGVRCVVWDNTKIALKGASSVGDALEHLTTLVSPQHPLAGFTWNYFFPQKNRGKVLINAGREVNHVFAFHPRSMVEYGYADRLRRYPLQFYVFLTLRCLIAHGVPYSFKAAVSFDMIESGGQANQRKLPVLVKTFERLAKEFPDYVKLVENTRNKRYQLLYPPILPRIKWAALQRLHQD